MGTDGIDGPEVYDRVVSFLMWPDESQEGFCRRCGLDVTALSRWKGGASVSIKSLRKMKGANGYSLDFIADGRVPSLDAARLIDRLESSVTSLFRAARAVLDADDPGPDSRPTLEDRTVLPGEDQTAHDRPA